MNKKTEVKCTGAMLTAGFHSASPPLIWRFDLERNHSFTIALQGEDGDWELGVTSPKGDFYPIAHFLVREDAEEAFTKIEKTLSRSRSAASSILKALLIVLVLALVIVFTVAAFVGYVQKHGSAARLTPGVLHTMNGGSPPPTVQPQDGVPQPADEVLQPPKQ